jgi:hypothetical protein
MDITLYIIIALLIAIVIGMSVGIVFMINLHEKRIGKYISRNMMNDTNHRAKNNFLILLLLETKGITTGVKSRAGLYRDFQEEVSNNFHAIKYDKDFLKKFIDGKNITVAEIEKIVKDLEKEKKGKRVVKKTK